MPVPRPQAVHIHHRHRLGIRLLPLGCDCPAHRVVPNGVMHHRAIEHHAQRRTYLQRGGNHLLPLGLTLCGLPQLHDPVQERLAQGGRELVRATLAQSRHHVVARQPLGLVHGLWADRRAWPLRMHPHLGDPLPARQAELRGGLQVVRAASRAQPLHDPLLDLQSRHILVRGIATHPSLRAVPQAQPRASTPRVNRG